MNAEARLRELLAAATPGPWVMQSSDDGVTDPWWIDTHAYPDGPEPVWAPPQYPVSGHDAVLIVAAVNALPKLLAVVSAARDIGDRDPTDEDPEPIGGAWCHFCQEQTPGHASWCEWTALRAALAALDTEGGAA